jgi:hypothetical protein
VPGLRGAEGMKTSRSKIIIYDNFELALTKAFVKPWNGDDEPRPPEPKKSPREWPSETFYGHGMGKA